MAGVLVILVILVGLPLLAWWLGGRSFWSRLEPGAEADLHRTLVRRHRLRPGEVVQVAAG
ncbi:hypothetical protein OF117_07190 [Geodermatophilus sp. YIM 151500]|uniref:hypothetical protein n=1 Tax=Geodermatophilus sp. YIM 151500 TaxID=2984531 RepID=UPI0021E4368A|nr:hypothetical protein [Geodermatophilus sp. YIM 151500]MCV2489145.1 hypothetical protein [Geodermatophilus sp. YIM 151500]